MKIYAVGGAVRDMLLNKTPHDFDYVVTGANIEEMIKLGFQQVGKSFPVFLHPQTRCEYALARKEIKTGPRHTDFSFVFDASVTLEEDLERRDFTCNALAQDCETGKIIDFHHGAEDIRHKILRHVNTKHFPEDPLRVLRMCRFAAQLGFTAAPETMHLAKEMVAAGMLQHLTAERVWEELHKALSYPNFWLFIATARACGALEAILPEVNRLWTTPERLEFHPEGNSGAHTLLCLRAAADSPALVKFGILLHDIGKIVTPKTEMPCHCGHETAGTDIIRTICRRLKTPDKYRDFALVVCANHMKFHCLPEMRLASIIRLVDTVTANHRPEYLEAFIAACRADLMGSVHGSDREQIARFEQNADLLTKVQNILKNITAADMPDFASVPKNAAFKERYQNFRLRQTKEQLLNLYGKKKN